MTTTKREDDKIAGLGRVRSITKIPTDYGDFTLAELNEMLAPLFREDEATDAEGRLRFPKRVDWRESRPHPDAIAKDPDAMELHRKSGSQNPIYGGPIAAPPCLHPPAYVLPLGDRLRCTICGEVMPEGHGEGDLSRTGGRELYQMTRAERMAIPHDPGRPDCMCFECQTGMARE